MQDVNTKKIRVIYDFGSNNGDDIPYYLAKSDLVVAVEANPILCREIVEKFSNEIASGKLVMENCVLTVDAGGGMVPFYLHRTNHVLSCFPKPTPDRYDDFLEVELPSRNVMDIIRQWGEPYYIKIDIEYYDQYILQNILLNGIRPPYISSEAHTIEIFCMLVSLGGYGSFKLMDGASVNIKYANHQIMTDKGPTLYSFPGHSAGPFGNDIKGDWMTRNNFFTLLGHAGLGWKDIHASNVDSPNHAHCPNPAYEIVKHLDF